MVTSLGWLALGLGKLLLIQMVLARLLEWLLG